MVPWSCGPGTKEVKKSRDNNFTSDLFSKRVMMIMNISQTRKGEKYALRIATARLLPYIPLFGSNNLNSENLSGQP